MRCGSRVLRIDSPDHPITRGGARVVLSFFLPHPLGCQGEVEHGLVLIDSGPEPDAGSLKQQMAALGLDWKRLCAILLTHAHADHILGAECLRASGAKVYAGRGDAAVLRAGGPREAFLSVFHMPEVVLHPTAVDVELAGEETLAFGDSCFRVLATPGHTPGSICYLLERQGLRVLFTGDVIQSLGGLPASARNPPRLRRRPRAAGRADTGRLVARGARGGPKCLLVRPRMG
jgi:glyoxylase-like metal-dependent hydrolase (beta-lactamase superfamily II)